MTYNIEIVCPSCGKKLPYEIEGEHINKTYVFECYNCYGNFEKKIVPEYIDYFNNNNNNNNKINNNKINNLDKNYIHEEISRYRNWSGGAMKSILFSVFFCSLIFTMPGNMLLYDAAEFTTGGVSAAYELINGFVILVESYSDIKTDKTSGTRENEYSEDKINKLIELFNEEYPGDERIDKLKNKYCSKIEYLNPDVRNTAVSVAKEHPGKWNAGQLTNIFYWIRENIGYVNDPLGEEYIAKASETINSKGGDCEDQSILMVSMIHSVGGTAKILVSEDCQHAYVGVYMANNIENFKNLMNSIDYFSPDQQNEEGVYYYYTDKKGYWLIVDPAGSDYLGGICPECVNTTFISLPC